MVLGADTPGRMYTMAPRARQVLDKGVTDGCRHLRADGGRCQDCGRCIHDVVLNGACFACGETDLTVSVKPAEAEQVVPASRLRVRKP